MSDPGSAISISLEELETRIRAIVGRRQDLPAAVAVAQTRGPSGGRSLAFANRLGVAATTLSSMTAALGRQLESLELLLAATGEELVAADESVAGDVQTLQRIADAIPVASPVGGSPSNPIGNSTLATVHYTPAPAGTTGDVSSTGSSGNDTGETLG